MLNENMEKTIIKDPSPRVATSSEIDEIVNSIRNSLQEQDEIIGELSSKLNPVLSQLEPPSENEDGNEGKGRDSPLGSNLEELYFYLTHYNKRLRRLIMDLRV